MPVLLCTRLSITTPELRILPSAQITAKNCGLKCGRHERNPQFLVHVDLFFMNHMLGKCVLGPFHENASSNLWKIECSVSIDAGDTSISP